MNYQEALDFIHDTHKFSIKLGLENVSRLLEKMGDPHKGLRFIHVAGTNGKGSTSSYLNHMLLEAGYKVGLYTSPFLEVFNERMRVNNEPIGDETLAEITTFVKTCIDQMLSEGHTHPTEFEIVTSIAFEYYKRAQVDVVVLEVGMGGRLDSTNVIESPLVSVITPIDLDHVEYLGDTIGKIAKEKAGIVKKGCPCVMHPQEGEAEAVIQEVCKALDSKLIKAPVEEIEVKSTTIEGTTFKVGDVSYTIQMLGEHQTRNALVALTAIEAINANGVLKISEEAVKSGLKKATWAGRLEVMHREPLVLIDGAHNLHGATGLSMAVKRLLPERKVWAIVGILGDKDIEGMLSVMMPLCHEVICTEPDNPRKMSAANLAEQVSKHGHNPRVEPSIEKAFKLAYSLAEPSDAIVCFGSLYMIGSMRTAIRRHFE